MGYERRGRFICPIKQLTREALVSKWRYGPLSIIWVLIEMRKWRQEF